MNRLLGLSLLILYINSYTELHEALRLPLLLEHYAEHRQQVKDMTFLEFLTMHYKTDVAHDDQDNRMPFKDRAHSFTAPVMALPLQKIMLKEATPLTEISHSSTYTEAYFSSHLSEIFQPPRHS
jgi:hypothetical protein